MTNWQKRCIGYGVLVLLILLNVYIQSSRTPDDELNEQFQDLISQDRQEDALKVLWQLIEEYPDSPWSRVVAFDNILKYHIDRREYDKAVAVAERWRRDYPDCEVCQDHGARVIRWCGEHKKREQEILNPEPAPASAETGGGA